MSLQGKRASAALCNRAQNITSESAIFEAETVLKDSGRQKNPEVAELPTRLNS
jgi:hypothetical protein